MIDTTELRKLSEAATPRPWVHGRWQYKVVDGLLHYTHLTPSNCDDATITSVKSLPPLPPDSGSLINTIIGGCGCCDSPYGNPADVDFIVAACNALPGLLDEFERLYDHRSWVLAEVEKQLQASRAEIDQLRAELKSIAEVADPDNEYPELSLRDQVMHLGEQAAVLKMANRLIEKARTERDAALAEVEALRVELSSMVSKS